MLLGSEVINGVAFYNGYTFSGHLSFLNDTYMTLPQILWIMLGFVGGAGAVYAIILGINLAKSESDDKRKTASTRLKNTLIGVFTLLLLVVFLNVLFPLILRGIWPNCVLTYEEFTGTSTPASGEASAVIAAVRSILKV